MYHEFLHGIRANRLTPIIRSLIAIFLLCFLFFISIDFKVTKSILFYFVKKKKKKEEEKREISVSKTPVVSLMPKPLDLLTPSPPPFIFFSISPHQISSPLPPNHISTMCSGTPTLAIVSGINFSTKFVSLRFHLRSSAFLHGFS
jgi:hypothetical protein